MSKLRKPKANKIIQIIPADSWVLEHYHPNTFESINSDEPVIAWALRESGDVVPLVANSDIVSPGHGDYRIIKKKRG